MSANEVEVEVKDDLLVAVCAGDNALIDHLIVRGADIKAKDVEGNTLLHWAVAKGHLETLKMLQEKGLDISITANNGYTLLHSATVKGQNEIVQYLLAAGSDVNVKSNDGYTPLHLAAWKGQVDTIKLLMRGGAAFEAKDNSDKTALDWAENHDAARDYLVLAGQRSADLKEAVMRFDNSAIDCLVAEDAYIHVKDDTGSTLLHWAAAAEGDSNLQIETMQHLIKVHKMDKNGKDNNGNTVLHTAAVNCRTAVIRYLVASGMDVNSAGAHGYTPLHLAAWKGHIDSVMFLVQNGADIYAKALDGRTALALATQHDTVRDYLEAISQQKLIDAVCKRDISEIKNLVAQGVKIPINAIHSAAHYNQVTTIEYFLSECNIDVDSKNPQGETALHVAACFGHQEAITCLLSRKTDPNSVDNNGFTPLQWAAINGQQEIVDILLAHGADPDIQDNHGKSYKELLLAQRQGEQSSSSNPLHIAGYFAPKTPPQAQDGERETETKSFAPNPSGRP